MSSHASVLIDLQKQPRELAMNGGSRDCRAQAWQLFAWGADPYSEMAYPIARRNAGLGESSPNEGMKIHRMVGAEECRTSRL